MKKIILYTGFCILLTAFCGCEKSAPTQLIQDQDQDQISVEVLSKDIDDEFYSNGFDSTGMADNPAQYTNIISLSGIKTSDNNSVTVKNSFAQAIFFDKSLPVKGPGGRILGYITRTPGIIRFNNILARRESFRIRFRGASGPADTALGLRYVLNGGRGFRNDGFDFDFSSTIKFELSGPGVFGNPVEINIPTPVEINAQAKVTGKLSEKNLSVVLEWEKKNAEKFEIIIGARKKNQQDVFPLYRIKTPDDGKVVIPSSLINQLPKDKFDKLNFAIIRKIEFDSSEKITDLHVISQSIYSIEVETH